MSDFWDKRCYEVRDWNIVTEPYRSFLNKDARYRSIGHGYTSHHHAQTPYYIGKTIQEAEQKVRAEICEAINRHKARIEQIVTKRFSRETICP